MDVDLNQTKMESVLSLHTDSLSIFPIHTEKTDTALYRLSFQEEPNLPYSLISANHYLQENLLYTICFLIIFAFIRLKGKDFFLHIQQIFIKRKKAKLIQNERIFSNLICYLLALGLSFSIIAGCLSIFVYGRFITIHTLYYFIGLLLYHFILLTIIHVFEWTFHIKYITQEITVHLWIYHISIGLLLSPFVLATFYIQHFAILPLLKIVIFGFGLLIIVKFLRWIEILYAHRVSIFYMILYLCSLEIIPLLVIYKVVL